MNYKLILLAQCLLSVCLCELSIERKEKILNDFVVYYNNLPNQLYTCDEGVLKNAQQIEPNTYKIEVNLKLSTIDKLEGSKFMTCTATVQDLQNNIKVFDDDLKCEEQQNIEESVATIDQPGVQAEVTEPAVKAKPVQLDNEIQANTAELAATSGEQFIAIRRERPSTPCVGCSTHVNPQAAGVSDLVSLGIKHLDKHESTVRHSLDTILDVERQVQVVNGVRYILTLLINFNSCTDIESDACVSTRACKISVLVKPWVKLPNGSKYRAILANNCTEEWQYGDNGEVLPEDSDDNRAHNEINSHPSKDDGPNDEIKVIHNPDVQSPPNQEKTLTEEEVKNIEEQIIPSNQFQQVLPKQDNHEVITVLPDSDVSKLDVVKDESVIHNTKNTLHTTEKAKHNTKPKHTSQDKNNLSQDKKQAIDDMLHFFEFSGFKPNSEVEEAKPRMKRSYDFDLQVLSLAENYQDIKKRLENAKFVYTVAQEMIDYLNEMDMTAKVRDLKMVLNAEEEFENYQHFVYIQALVTIPCDKAECKPDDTITRICNGVIDCTNKDAHQILNTFCHKDHKEKSEIANEVPANDPVLQNLVKTAIKKIESESSSKHAMVLNKIVSANTRQASGTLTKISITIDYINCNKSVPYLLKKKCTVLEQLGSKICEVIFHERHWLKEKKLSYTCTDVPVDVRISKEKVMNENQTIDDPKIREMLRESLQHLEMQSNRNNKQKIVKVNSVTSQIIAGFLTKIEFLVGYTTCSNEYVLNQPSKVCELLPNERLRKCLAQFWDRSWIEDGRQMEVACDDDLKNNNNELKKNNDTATEKPRKKRSLEAEIVGGESEKNVNDPIYRALALKSLQNFMKTSSSQQHYDVTKINRVNTQIAAGELVRIYFKISPTNCQIGSDGALSSLNCYIINPENTHDCHSEILEQDLSNKKKITVSCQVNDGHSRLKRNILVGGQMEQNPKEPQYIHLAEESLKKYVATSGSCHSQFLQFVEVVRVTTQVVAGSLTRLNFTVSSKEHSDQYKCYSEVWERPWLNDTDIQVTCNIEDQQHSRSKRDVLVGGELEKNPKEPMYIQLADKSLKKFVAASGSSDSQSLHLIEVVRVTTQVVAGSLTRLNFTVSSKEHSDNIKCFSKVWERPWLNDTDIQVTCNIEDQQHSRSKRGALVGGEMEQNPQEPVYIQLAEKSLKKFVAASGLSHSQSFQLLRVNKVTKQVVAGSLTRLNFTVSSKEHSDNIKCFSKVWERPWLNDTDIQVTCNIEDQQNSRSRRGALVGGEMEQNPQEPVYIQLAEKSLKKFVAASGSSDSQSLHLIEVVRVTTQVVAGSLTRLNFTVSSKEHSDNIKCFSKVWERPWLNDTDIQVTCNIEDQQHSRSKRGALVGGEMEQNPQEPVYIQLAEKSLKKFVAASGSSHSQSFQLLRVNKVTKQVVAGSLTRLNFTVSSKEHSDQYKCYSEVWERPWLNDTDIQVTCNIEDQQHSRSKRDVLVGGELEQNPKEPMYIQLAEKSLKKFVAASGSSDSQSLHLIEVVRVTTQVVAGSLTRLNFTVSSKEHSDNIKCFSKVWERPWLNDTDIQVTCNIEDQQHSRSKRGALVGGEMEQNPQEPVYIQLAEKSLKKFVAASGSSDSQSLHLIEVVRVTTQVVAGSLTRLNFTVSSKEHSDNIKCFSKVWERPWLNDTDIQVTCNIEDQQHSRSKRGALVGGEMEQNPQEPVYIQLAEKSLKKFVAASGSSHSQSFQLLRVNKVTKQVVAGSLTRLNFTVSSKEHSDQYKCYSEVWERPWLNDTDIQVTCNIEDQQHSRSKRDVLVGGELEQNPKEPMYIQLAEKSLKKFVAASGSSDSQSLHLIEVVRVTTQVVAGSLTRLNFTVSSKEHSDNIKCFSKVWERPWLNDTDIQVTCNIEDQQHSRSKRGALVGGEMEQNPQEPVYIQLAEKSLKKFVAASGSSDSQFLQLLRVNKVTTQVVAGSLTRLNFTVSSKEHSDNIKCFSKVWEQPWLNDTDIQVICNIEDQQHSRTRRQSNDLTECDPSDPKYTEMAKKSLQKYMQNAENSQSLKLIRLEKVTTEDVEGLITRIDFVVADSKNSEHLKCQSKIWELASSNDINVQCIKEENSSGKREIFRGGEKSRRTLKNNARVQNPNNKQYHSLAEESLREYERLKNNGVNHKVVEVKHVATQVVGGIIYVIDFTATPTTSSANIADVNRNHANNMIMYCHTKIWSQSWIQLKEIDVSCYSDNESDNDEYDNNDAMRKPKILKNSRTGLLGAPEAINVDTPIYMKLAKEALNKYFTESNVTFIHKVTKIHNVSEEVAEGIITTIEFSVSPTTCLREEPKESENDCEIKKPKVDMRCIAEIWDRPWLNEKDINVDCERSQQENTFKLNTKFREKRQAPIDDDYVDDEMKYYYANRALQHVNEQSRSGHLHKLITIHAVQHSVQMKTTMVRMYIELAETFCLRHQDELDLQDCEEMDGQNHKLCLARLWPSPDDELVVRHTSVICDDEDDFESVSGLHIADLLKMSMREFERSPLVKFKTVHQGEPHIVPSLDSKTPIVLNFLLATTNCTKNVNLTRSLFACYVDISLPTKSCTSYIWLMPNGKSIKTMRVSCSSLAPRTKRSASDATNTTADDIQIQKLVTAALEKLEMESLQRFKQRVLQINSHSTKITSGRVTTIDFDVGYTACLKYEWVENVTSCEFLEHLPRRHCVAQIWERLWLNNGRNIDVRCEDDETPLESHIEFESAEMAMELALAALKHIEAKYPHPKKQKVVRIYSLEKQVVAGVHYRMKIEVALTDCIALSERSDCKVAENLGVNKFCRVNVWIRPWTNHPPNYRVSCDYQDGTTTELYRNIQVEYLFYEFVTTNNPTYMNDHVEMRKRFEIFKANVGKIQELNIYEMGTARYGITRFADLTYEEFRTKYTGLKPSLQHPNKIPMSKAHIPPSKIPESFDWRDYDAVTDVKDQGSCGSCWAFSVTGNIEGQWKMQSGQLVSLSEQELVDCDKMDEGCNGGMMDNAYRAIEELGGLEAESDYPYEGEDDKCGYNKTLSKVQISGAVNISSNETEMAMWLLHNGPISIGINANAMQFYLGGISHPWKMLCNPTNLDHGVLIVGYGVKDYPLFHKHLPYWTVKNSWGTSWGEQGYYRVYRGDGTCGVNQMASSAVI